MSGRRWLLCVGVPQVAGIGVFAALVLPGGALGWGRFAAAIVAYGVTALGGCVAACRALQR